MLKNEKFRQVTLIDFSFLILSMLFGIKSFGPKLLRHATENHLKVSIPKFTVNSRTIMLHCLPTLCIPMKLATTATMNTMKAKTMPVATPADSTKPALTDKFDERDF